MIGSIRKTAVFAAVILSVGAVTALAANSPPLVGVKKSAMNGVHRATGANGALKANAVGNRQIKFGSVSCRKLSADLMAALCTGKRGAGKDGGTGSNGDKGGPGSNGNNGGKGDNGDNGTPASATQYGIVNVYVSRGHNADGVQNAPATWATYSTALGSPVGDNTGGSFRFTCSSANAPCVISVRASVTGATNHTVIPRVLIYNAGDGNGQGAPLTTCEYLDGPFTAATPAGADVALGAGGSFDCGLPDTSYSFSVDTSVYGAGKTVTKYIVPAGYYDLHSTFVFRPAA